MSTTIKIEDKTLVLEPVGVNVPRPIAFVNYDGAAGVVSSKFGVTSVVKIGTGVYDVQISVADPAVDKRLPLASTPSAVPVFISVSASGSGVYRIRVWNVAGAAADAQVRFALWEVAGGVAGP